MKGKIVVLLRYEPAGFAAKSGNQGLTTPRRADHQSHQRAKPRRRGGRDRQRQSSADGEDDLLTHFGSVSGPENAGMLLVQVKNAVAQDWFAAAGKSSPAVQEADQFRRRSPHPSRFPTRCISTLDVQYRDARAPPSTTCWPICRARPTSTSSSARTTIISGYGTTTRSRPRRSARFIPARTTTLPGTAGVLELARLFAPFKGQLQRGILFMSFAGEELGLLGSADWVKDPTGRSDKAVAMLNMDMIGRIRDEQGLYRRRRHGIDVSSNPRRRPKQAFPVPTSKILRAVMLRAITPRL